MEQGSNSYSARNGDRTKVSLSTNVAYLRLTGTTLILHAVGSNGSIFNGWSNGTGNAIGCSSTLADCSMTLTVPTTVTANFILNAEPLTPPTPPTISPGSM